MFVIINAPSRNCIQQIHFYKKNRGNNIWAPKQIKHAHALVKVFFGRLKITSLTN
jgi:hypothetical protein